MLVSLDWIKDLTDVEMSVEETAHALTMAGLEVEGIEEVEGDHVLDVNVTPDRPDCLSMLGIAREISAITGRPVRLPERGIGKSGPSDFRIEILDEELCPRYAGRVVRGVKVAESPRWMRERLEKCGIRAINNIVDITNYTLLEFGHPLHAFDLSALSGAAIRVGAAGKGRSMTTLDGVERRLPEDALLIWDAERPVAVAGVMGGAETEVTVATTEILIESAYFNPLSIRRTSKALGLKSESSYRFERGTDIVMLEAALDRAAHLVERLAGGKAEDLLDAYPLKFGPRPITVNYQKVNRVLGADIPSDEMIGLLMRLGLNIKDDGDSFEVTPPSYRPDLAMDADIIEEVARLYGYERIPTVIPKAALSSGGIQKKRRLLGAVNDAMTKEGFHEAVNYSFMNIEHLDALGIPDGDARRRCVEIKNPLRKEDSHMRSTLLPSLLENLRHNLSHGMRDIRLFEAGRVFEDSGSRLPNERLRLAGICVRDDSPSLYRETTEGFYVIKGAVEAVLDGLRITGCAFAPSGEHFLHPGKSAGISMAGSPMGFMGALSPVVAERLDIRARGDILLFELDLEALLKAVPEGRTYRPIPKFPAIGRDIAVLLDEGITSAEVTGLIRDYPSEFIEEVSVFDSYRGRGIPTGRKSLGVSVTYRSKERTLTDGEVDETHGKLVEHVVRKTGGELRA